MSGKNKPDKRKIAVAVLRTSSPETIAAFQARLQRAGITTTLRASRGEDILAACGLLAGKGLRKPDPEP